MENIGNLSLLYFCPQLEYSVMYKTKFLLFYNQLLQIIEE